MLKRLLKFLLFLLTIALIIAGFLAYGMFVSVERVNLNYQSAASSKIPKSLDNVQIAFISDIDYNAFMDKTRLSKMMKRLNDAHPDVIIFGGDLFYAPEKQMPDDTKQQEITEILKKLDAPLGKFAVLGEQDLMNKDIKNMVSSILYNSDFEMITNQLVRIRKGDNASISLIGLDSMIGGQPDITGAFENVNANEFNMVFTHCPDLIAQLPTNNIDVMVAGHSHGGQIALPLLGPLHKMSGAEAYSKGTYKVQQTTLSVSNGLGTRDTDVRLFAPPEVIIYRLANTK